MHRFQNQVVGVGDECLFAPCICAPQKIYDGGIALVEMTDDAIRESFPTFALVAIGPSCTHRQYGVEKEHSLLCPFHKVWVGVVNAKVCLDLFEYIDKGWGSVCAG